jgi:twitching motility protein PilT
MPQKSFSQNEPDYSGEPEAKEKLSDTDTELEYTMDDLFHLVVEESGSDLHLSINAPPVIRVHGQMIKTKLPNINKDQMRHLLMGLLNNDQRDKLDEIWEIDFSLSVPGLCRFRCNVFHQKDGLSGVFRVIPQKIPTLRQLNMPAIIGDLAKKHKGLVLVTGPTGNGKSTTLAAMVDMINSERHEHIITIEDPIEFAHVHKKCIINQREVGQDTKSFSMALRSALREDPDIILVGELRDLETIQMALTAAETGHLVFGTLHTSSAYKTIDRIIDVFPPHQQEQIRVQLGETLQAVVAQQLIPLADGSGRICAQEILINSPAIGNLIREGKTYQIFSVLQTSKQQGMQTMDQALKTLLKHKKITYEEAFKRATDKKSFEKY